VSDGTDPEVRSDAVLVGQRDEGVIFHGRRPARGNFCVDLAGGAKKVQRLVDDVAAEVQHDPPALCRTYLLPPRPGDGFRPPALETRLEARDRTQLTGGLQPLDRQRVTVPAAIVKHTQEEAGAARGFDQPPALRGGRCQRLVDDHRQPVGDRLQARVDVVAGGRGDHHEVMLRRPLPERPEAVEQAHPRVVGEAPGLPLRVGGHH